MSYDSYLCSAFSSQNYYSDSEYIIRQGAVGDTFFIISEGQVRKKDDRRMRGLMGGEKRAISREGKWQEYISGRVIIELRGLVVSHDPMNSKQGTNEID